MAQILDKQGLQHYANKMCNADNRKVGSKSLSTALNDIDTAIDGFKTLFETEYGTPVNMELENNENVFSIGTGINIDKKDDVENSFTDVELSGNSLVNLCPQTYNFTTVTTKGEAILDGLDVTYNSPTYRIKAFTLTQPLKPNTTYTAIVNILSLVNSGAVSSYVKYSDGEAVYNQFSATQLGLNIKKFTTSNKIATELAYYLHDGECSAKISGVIILEGDWTNKPIPQYFEGMKSIGEKEDGNHKISILSRGKNLFDTNLLYGAEILSKDLSSFIFQGWASHSISNSDVKKLFKPNTTYTIKAKAKIIKKVGTVPVYDYDVGGTFYHVEMTPNYFGRFKSKTMYNLGDEAILETTFTTPNCLDKYELRLYSNRYADENVTQYDIVEFSEIQLEESTTSSEFDSYKEDKKEISLNEPLRGLPNGIKDTIEKVNGEWKIVRRCVQIDLNGTEGWYHENPSQEDGVNTALFASSKILNAKNFPQLCDRFIPKNGNLMLNSHPDSEGVGCWSAKDNVNIRINKSRLSTVDSAGFKAWLSQNPTKVLFELKTPIIEYISPITLQCWKNGTISIDEVLPIETTHTVALNKSAQIQKNIEELSILRNRIEALEKQYNNSTLNQAYELELLRFDMELDNII